MSSQTRSSIPTRSRGFSLVELLVAISIAVFLMGGLVSLVFALRRTNTIQTGLSQLQDEERLSLSLIGDVIQTSGYFPIEPVGWVSGQALNTASAELPPSGSFTFSGQGLTGTGTASTTAPFDTLSVRYVTSGTDNVINCSGSANTTAANVTNVFQIGVVNGTSYLQCVLTVNNNVQTINLVPGVTKMQVYYGVRTNTGWGTNSVDTYLTANAVTNGAINYWPYVLSVKVILTFVNPLYCAAAPCQQGQTSTVAPTVQFSTIVDVMNQTGITT
jgi:type IV pilus assembly protein PilW